MLILFSLRKYNLFSFLQIKLKFANVTQTIKKFKYVYFYTFINVLNTFSPLL